MRLCSIGDNIVDCYADLGVMCPGGNAVNVAVGARRAGCEAAYVGVVGNDTAGRVVLDALTLEGVATERLRMVEGPTAHATVELVKGERVFVDHDLGVSELTLDEDDLAYAATFDLVHTGDCSVLEAQLPKIAGAAPVSFDFSTRPETYCAALLPYVKVASFSAGDRDLAGVETLLRDAVAVGPSVALATAGSRGAVLLLGERLYRTEAHDAATVLDTLGAGDAFISRVLVGVLGEEEPRALLRAASHAAAQTVEQIGGFGHPAPLERPMPRTGRKLW